MKVPQHPHERLLGRVLGILSLPEHPVAESKDLPPKTLDQSQHR